MAARQRRVRGGGDDGARHQAPSEAQQQQEINHERKPPNEWEPGWQRRAFVACFVLLVVVCAGVVVVQRLLLPALRRSRRSTPSSRASRPTPQPPPTPGQRDLLSAEDVRLVQAIARAGLPQATVPGLSQLSAHGARLLARDIQQRSSSSSTTDAGWRHSSDHVRQVAQRLFAADGGNVSRATATATASQGSQCWHNSAGSVRCLPSYFVLGTQKAGTTALHARLLRHPRVAGSLPKEPQWWDKEAWRCGSGSGSAAAWAEGLDRYLASVCGRAQSTQLPQRLQRELRQRGGPGLPSEASSWVCGDHTVSTLSAAVAIAWCPTGQPQCNQQLAAGDDDRVYVAEVMREFLPASTHFIVLVRDPAERLYSAWRFYLYQQRRLETYLGHHAGPATPERFHVWVQHTLQRFTACVRRKGDNNSSDSPSFWTTWWPCMQANVVQHANNVVLPAPVFPEDGLVAAYLHRWLMLSGRPVTVIEASQLRHNATAVVRSVAEMLGLAARPQGEEGEEEDEEVDEFLARMTESSAGEMKHNQGRVDIGPMLPATRALLHEFYAPFDALTRSLVAR